MVSGIDNLSLEMVKKALDASSARNRVISHNIANVNTKGYKSFKVVFEDKLKQAIIGESLSLKTTNNNHLSDGTSLESMNYEIKKDNSTTMRTDGNNVDIDNEMTNLAANAILYNSLVSQANSKFAMRRYVISEGRR